MVGNYGGNDLRPLVGIVPVGMVLDHWSTNFKSVLLSSAYSASGRE